VVVICRAGTAGESPSYLLNNLFGDVQVNGIGEGIVVLHFEGVRNPSGRVLRLEYMKDILPCLSIGVARL
jgi:hypothetical protein